MQITQNEFKKFNSAATRFGGATRREAKSFVCRASSKEGQDVRVVVALLASCIFLFLRFIVLVFLFLESIGRRIID
jgi:hypothetical protein